MGKRSLEGFLWSHQSMKLLMYPRHFALKDWFLANEHFPSCSFWIYHPIPWCLKFEFLWRHTFLLYCCTLNSKSVRFVKLHGFNVRASCFFHQLLSEELEKCCSGWKRGSEGKVKGRTTMRFITEPAVSEGVNTRVNNRNSKYVNQVTHEESERINEVSLSSQKHLF